MKIISLTENHMFSKVFRNRNGAVKSTVAVYILKDGKEKKLRKANPEKQSVNRIGISASKKIGGAVERNRAKRVIREAYRQIDREYGVKKGWIIVFAAREKTTVCKMQDVKIDMHNAFAELDMLL